MSHEKDKEATKIDEGERWVLMLLNLILLYAFVRTADLAISSVLAKDVGRAIVYGLSLLIMIIGVLALIGVLH